MGTTASTTTAVTASTATTVATVRRLYDRLSEGRVAEIAELVAPDFTGHGLGAGGRDGLIEDLESWRAAFPDVSVEIRDVIADRDRVVVHGTLRGTHRAPYAGVPASGSTVEVATTDIWRVDTAGNLAECWTVCDSGTLLMQIGAIDPAPAAQPSTDDERAGAFVGRLFEAAVGGWELLTTHVGLRLGLYAAVSDAATGVTTSDLADAAGIHPRYAQEWLEQQAISGIIEVDDVTAAPETRRFTLPAPHAEVLLNEQSPFHAAPLADWTASVPLVLPQLMEAYRTGGGLAWGDFGETVLDGQAAFNRPLFEHTLAANLEAHLPDVDARLKAGGGRIADVACGYGWSTVALANAYPNATVDGIDADGPSVEKARKHVADAGVAARVTIAASDAAAGELGGTYDLVTIFEAVHDMSQPVEVLANIRRALSPGGAVLVMDENVADTFGEGIGNPVERFMYTASLLCCLPAGMAGQPSAATGTVMRPATMRRYAEEAGFASVTELPVADGFHRYYRLDA